jgi:hypothetical protein
MSSGLTDLDGLGRLRALQLFSSEIGANDKNLEDCEMEGNTPVQGVLQIDWICLTNRQQLCRVQPNEYHQPQAKSGISFCIRRHVFSKLFRLRL